MIAADLRARLRLMAEDLSVYATATFGTALSLIGGWAAHRYIGDAFETLVFVGSFGVWVVLAALVLR